MRNKRVRSYFLTINKNAECFDNLADLVAKATGPNDYFAYILHDKDTKETGEIVEPHYHLLIVFKNARSFEAIQRLFVGAHIEETLNIVSAVNYLVHNGKPNKYAYDKSAIVTNSTNWLNSKFQVVKREEFIEDKLPFYVLCENCDSFLRQARRFGASQLPTSVITKTNAIIASFQAETPENRTKILEGLEELYGTKDEDEEEDNNLPF